MRLLSFAEAVAALRRGEVVAVPTDTVYGVAARLEDADAVAKLFSVKSRPSDVALPVLVQSSRDVVALDVEWSVAAQRLADRFWPGALTIVVGAAPALAARVGATSSVGIRAPRHVELAALIDQCGPLAVTSANEHGHAPCVSADDVLAIAWGAPIAGALDGGVCDGAVSTVVEVSADGWWVRRRGAIALVDLEAVLGPESAARDN